MGNNALGTLTPAPTPTAPGKSGVFWTQFPATALTGRDGLPVDWGNHKNAHQAVSRLFTPGLPGDHETRRAESGILYRVDRIGDQAVVLVQSLIAPELTPAESRTTEVSERQWRIEAEEQIAFRFAVNPVKRTTVYRDGGNGRNADGTRNRTGARRAESLVPMANLEDWVGQRLAGALNNIEFVSHYRDTTISGRHRVVVDTIDALATVTDSEAFSRLRVDGIGRSKAYGAGLLTATRMA